MLVVDVIVMLDGLCASVVTVVVALVAVLVVVADVEAVDAD